LLVVYEVKSDFESDLSRLESRFPHARKLKTQPDQDVLNGGDGTVPLMLIHPQSAGYGINLQHGGCNIA
jgi:hypothetical protein